VFDKIGSGVHDVPNALFYLAASGMPQNLALAVMDKAASEGTAQCMYGLRPLSVRSAIVKEAFVDAYAKLGTRGYAIPKAPCLLKEAMAIEMHKEAKTLVGVDSPRSRRPQASWRASPSPCRSACSPYRSRLSSAR
jgi:hypothetical protein